MTITRFDGRPQDRCRSPEHLGATLSITVATRMPSSWPRVALLVSLLFAAGASAWAQVPVFVERTGADNPFDGIVGDVPTPTLIDLDTDGDLDLALGNQTYGVTVLEASAPEYFMNWKNARAAAYQQETGSSNPFSPFANAATPDGAVAFFPVLNSAGVTYDAVVGGEDGRLKHLHGVGVSDATYPSVNQLVAATVATIDVGSLSKPNFADLDGDGDVDLIVGNASGTVSYWENVAPVDSTEVSDFEARTGSANPFNGIDVGINSHPACGDLDGDGDADCIIASFAGPEYAENAGTGTAPSFVLRTGAENPFDGWPVIRAAAPSLGDLDADGDLDLVMGTDVGQTLRFFENTSPTTSAFEWITGVDDPFMDSDPPSWSDPTFVDVDGDGDLDCFVGDLFGDIAFFENTTTGLLPVFVERTGLSNPLGQVSLSSYTSLTFADIDADGDQDLLLGGGQVSGALLFYRNEGTPTTPAFSFATLQGLSGVAQTLGPRVTPRFVDIDGDSDFDLVIGRRAGDFKFWENVGSPQFESFVELPGFHPISRVVVGSMFPLPSEYTCNGIPENGPLGCFGKLQTAGYSAIRFADVDRDGDLDAAVGDETGQVLFFENVGSAQEPLYSQRYADNPLRGILTLGFPGANELGYSKAELVDIDRDGDIDVVLGQIADVFQYYRNNTPPPPPPFFADGFESGDLAAWQ